MQMDRARIPVELFADYHLSRTSDSKRLVVLLHGFEQIADKMFTKFEPVLSKLPHYSVLAPNGPFPLPRRVEDRFRLGCAWYFYDRFKDAYYMDMEIGVRFVKGLVTQLGLASLPTTLIGFSQGGYLAPFLAQAMPQVDHVIGIGCEFLVEEMESKIPFRMDCIHGAKDDVVPVEDARRQRQLLDERKVPGRFYPIENGGHRIDEATLSIAAELLTKSF